MLQEEELQGKSAEMKFPLSGSWIINCWSMEMWNTLHQLENCGY